MAAGIQTLFSVVMTNGRWRDRSSANAQTPGCTDRASVERYIRESEAQGAESVATGNTSANQRILADDFIGTDPKGNLYDKAQMIADARDAPK